MSIYAQVAPAELEALINSLPSVKDVVVIPVLDEAAGEIPRAYVVPADGVTLSEQEVSNNRTVYLCTHLVLSTFTFYLNVHSS